MKVAYVHDWLVTYRGGEKVLEALLELYPDAPIYTLFYKPADLPASITSRKVIYPVWLNKLRKFRKALLPIFPGVMDRWDFSDYDLLISTSSCVAKAARPRQGAKHICYLHSPMRYIWDQQDEYLKGLGSIPLAAPAIRSMTPWLRRWDVDTADRVHRFVVNSSFVQERTQSFYNRDSVVIHPPVELDRFRPLPQSDKSDYYLAAGAWVSYKRFDLAIAACRQAGVKLKIMGGGPMASQLRHQAGQHVDFIEKPSDEEWTNLMRGAKALLFPGVEDFGITAIEALACGTPVIALKQGGALDFVIEGKTGLFFEECTPDALATALDQFKGLAFDSDVLAEFASGFNKGHFLKSFQREIASLSGEIV